MKLIDHDAVIARHLRHQFHRELRLPRNFDSVSDRRKSSGKRLVVRVRRCVFDGQWLPFENECGSWELAHNGLGSRARCALMNPKRIAFGIALPNLMLDVPGLVSGGSLQKPLCPGAKNLSQRTPQSVAGGQREELANVFAGVGDLPSRVASRADIREAELNPTGKWVRGRIP